MKGVTFLLFLVAILISSVIGAPSGNDSRIVGGQAIHNSNIPYIMRIFDADGGYCGGTLVAPTVVVTAAHCVYGKPKNTIRVIAGVTKISDNGITRYVSRMFTHPKFRLDTMYSDVAALLLSESLPHEPLPLCTRAPMEGEDIRVSGWGRTGTNDVGANTLLTVLVPVRSYQRCKQEYGEFVKENMFCASGYEEKGSCRGDSGGPGEFNNELCAIVSFSYECGKVGSVEVYTDVLSVKPDIEKFMNNPQASEYE